MENNDDQRRLKFEFEQNRRFKKARDAGHEPEGCASEDCHLCGPIFEDNINQKGETR